MKITMLGTGASGGVPLIGCDCEVCVSGDSKNHRTRSSILIEENGTNILIDTAPDLREQALANNITKVDAVLYTHSHADHINGIDDMRSFNFLNDGEIPIYGDSCTIQYIMEHFAYVFTKPQKGIGWYKPYLLGREIEFYDQVKIGNAIVSTFEQIHGSISVIGLRIGDFAYSTDVNEMPERSLRALEGVKTWIVDCVKYGPSPTHANLEQALKWIDIIKPERAILTHMAHEIDYNKIKSELPDNVEPGYDGMVIEVK